MPNEPRPLSISISRKSVLDNKSQWAVFHDFNCVKPFVEYTDEAAAIAEGKAWIKQSGLPGADLEPEIVYPRITKMRMS